MRIKRAMLFAAGLGTRMRPLTSRMPKALVEVSGKPLIDHALARFGEAGLERVVVNTHHFAERTRAHLERRSDSFELCVSHEPELLETGGGIVRALPLLGEAPFFSANADAIWLDGPTKPALERMAQHFDEERFDALLLLHPRELAIGYRGAGNFDLAADGTLRCTSSPAFVFTGVQILHPRLFATRAATPFSLRELYVAAQGPDGALARMAGLVHDGDFLHVGTPAERDEANAFFANKHAVKL
jgi:MurNAc alpha-1-phosphate uridylyltransferase